MTRTTLSMHRRTRIERRVLALLRGERTATLSDEQAICFDDLRRHAACNGLVIADLGTSYAAEDELTLMAWIADAQRLHPMMPAPADPQLADAIRCSAAILSMMRLRLSPLTLYSGRIRPAPSSSIQR